jgi:dienelactone hydrolase
MFRKLMLCALALLASTACFAASCEYTVEKAAYKNLVANLYRPASPHAVPVVIAFGGSEGGLSTGDSSGEMLAPHCIAVLGLAYFKETGLPSTLDQIPLEYFIDAIDYVSKQAGINAARIGIVSGSRGSEAALLVASMDVRIKSVVVATPSEVAWGGMTTPKSAWTFRGTDIPVPALQAKRFDTALDNIEDWRKYRIAVERINGPIFLISAENDQIWPSTRMSGDIVSYLAQKNFKFNVRHDSYPTGHGFSKELAPGIKQSVVNRFLDTL